MQKFLNTLWEFPGGKKDKDNFIQKTIKVYKVFKVKPLKTPKPDVPSKKTAYNLFCKEIRKTRKELQGVPISKARAIISKEWKKVKASEKKIKKYKGLYEEEKQRHEEALQMIKKIIWMKWRLLNFRKGVIRQTEKQSQRQPQRPLRADITLLWGSSFIRWQEKIKKTIGALCQEDGKRSKKILKGYLHTMIGQGIWKMRQEKGVMIHKMKKWW